MNSDINIILFNLFFTLILPKYNDLKNESDVLKITKEELEAFAEDDVRKLLFMG